MCLLSIKSENRSVRRLVCRQLTLKKQKLPSCDNAGLLTMGETSVTPVCRVH